jgi:hypothetical protein
MDTKATGLVQGTLHMLILKTLALEPMHGYGIGVRLEQISKGVFQVNAGHSTTQNVVDALNNDPQVGALFQAQPPTQSGNSSTTACLGSRVGRCS